jgi:hypothetical protein
MYVGLIGAFPVFLFLILYCVVGIEKDTNAIFANHWGRSRRRLRP